MFLSRSQYQQTSVSFSISHGPCRSTAALAISQVCCHLVAAGPRLGSGLHRQRQRVAYHGYGTGLVRREQPVLVGCHCVVLDCRFRCHGYGIVCCRCRCRRH